MKQTRQLPANINSNDSILFDEFLEREFKIKVNARVEKDIYVSNEPFFYNQQGRLLSDISLYLKPKNPFKNSWTVLKHFLKLRWQKETVHLEEAAFLTDDWSNNYFHWHIDVIQRLLMIRELFDTKEPLILLPGRLRACHFIVDSINLLNLKIRFIDDDEFVKVKRLLLPNYYFPPGVIDENRVQAIKKVILPYYNPEFKSYEKIYISRASAGRRKVVNEIELIRFLTNEGFHIIQCDSLTLSEQASVFKNTKILISNHGAGLTNMMYMKPNTVIELRGKKSFRQWCYFEMASVFRHQYFYLLCDSDSKDHDPHTENIIVDIDQLKSLMVKYNIL